MHGSETEVRGSDTPIDCNSIGECIIEEEKNNSLEQSLPKPRRLSIQEHLSIDELVFSVVLGLWSKCISNQEKHTGGLGAWSILLFLTKCWLTNAGHFGNRKNKHMILVLDRAGWHSSQKLKVQSWIAFGVNKIPYTRTTTSRTTLANN